MIAHTAGKIQILWKLGFKNSRKLACYTWQG